MAFEGCATALSRNHVDTIEMKTRRVLRERGGAGKNANFQTTMRNFPRKNGKRQPTPTFPANPEFSGYHGKKT